MSKTIKVYTTTWCGNCRRAKAWLNDNRVPYEEINIEQDEKAVDYVQKVNHGMHSVPTIVFPDGSSLTEPSNSELEEKVKTLHLMPHEDTKIIFVYNANSSVFSQITDYAHKLIAPSTYQCNLCKITYGNLGMKQKWKEFIQKLPYKIDFLHKDELLKVYPIFQNTPFPAVFREKNHQISQIINSEDINRQHNIAELRELVLSKVEKII